MLIPNEPFLTSHLSDLGLTVPGLRKLLADGSVRRVFQGVYCPTSLPDSIEVQARCASLALPSHAVVCDRSAALLHGVDVLDPGEHVVVPRLEIVSERGHTGSVRSGVYGGVRDLLAEDVMVLHGVRVTTPVRTALDLACLRGPHSALAILDAFRSEHGLEVEELQRLLSRYKRRRGVVQLRKVVPLAIAESESPGESFTRSVMIRAGFPAPAAQIWITVPGVGECRVDLAYPGLKIAVEYDGEEFHGPDQVEYDEKRRQGLRALGWILIVVRKHDLSDEGSQWWLTELRQAVAERVPAFRRTYPKGEPWTR